MIEHALAILLTGGSFVFPPSARVVVGASGLTASRYGNHIDMATALSVNTGASLTVRLAPGSQPNQQSDLLLLLNRWIEGDPIEADADYPAQRTELEMNSISFGVA